MIGAALVLASGLAAPLTYAADRPAVGTGLSCRFTEACIDGRPCFDSELQVQVVILGSDLAQINLGDGRIRLARIQQDGVWTSFQTEPNRDHSLRGEILDMDAEGRATLVVSSPGEAIEMLSRTGHCTATSTSETQP